MMMMMMMMVMMVMMMMMMMLMMMRSVGRGCIQKPHQGISLDPAQLWRATFIGWLPLCHDDVDDEYDEDDEGVEDDDD